MKLSTLAALTLLTSLANSDLLAMAPEERAQAGIFLAFQYPVEIPGVNKDEIQVTIEGNQVTLGAEVKREKEVKDGQRALRTERYYGTLYRSFSLPSELDEVISVTSAICPR